MNVKRSDCRLAAVLLLVLLVFVCACGKKGAPVPQEARYKFSWGETSATIVNDCLVISAQLEGAYDNAEGFLLETEPTTDNICLDCPFRPTLTHDIQPSAAQEGLLTFQYCPETVADSYRWRLVARNIYRSLPNVLTPVGLVTRPF